jgi:hypothetical protein
MKREFFSRRGNFFHEEGNFFHEEGNFFTKRDIIAPTGVPIGNTISFSSSGV